MSSLKFDVEFPTCREGVLVPPNFCSVSDLPLIAQEAEALGIHGLWATDFMMASPCYGVEEHQRPNWFEPIATLAYVAALTKTIRLGTGVLMAPLREPVVLAKQVATLDRLSGGRLSLGLGLGMCRDEFAMLRPHMASANRGEILQECIEVLQGLLGNDSGPFSYSGDHYKFDGIRLDPRPMQQPLPIFVPGHSAASIKRAVQLQLSILSSAGQISSTLQQVENASAESGIDFTGELVVEAELRIDRDLDTAAQNYRSSQLGRFRLSRTSQPADAVIDMNWIGPPELIAERISALTALGVTHFNAVHIAADTLPDYLDQVRMFATEVAPRVKNLSK